MRGAPPSLADRSHSLECSQSFVEGPRIASTIDLPNESSELSSRQDRSLAPKGSVVTGSCFANEAEDFPRRHPLSGVSSLHETDKEGSAVMSGRSHGVASMQGKMTYPTRNFATLGRL